LHSNEKKKTIYKSQLYFNIFDIDSTIY